MPSGRRRSPQIRGYELYSIYNDTTPLGENNGSFALGAGDCTMLARAAEDSARPHVGAITATLGLTTTY
jgi:hypothetical protein